LLPLDWDTKSFSDITNEVEGGQWAKLQFMKSNQKTNDLRGFLHNKGLINDDSLVAEFMAYVSIKTAENRLDSTELKVNAILGQASDFGRLSFLENRLDALIYPTDFDAKWQRFRNMEDQYLLISGTHPKKMIGKYTVEIRLL